MFYFIFFTILCLFVVICSHFASLFFICGSFFISLWILCMRCFAFEVSFVCLIFLVSLCSLFNCDCFATLYSWFVFAVICIMLTSVCHCFVSLCCHCASRRLYFVLHLFLVIFFFFFKSCFASLFDHLTSFCGHFVTLCCHCASHCLVSFVFHLFLWSLFVFVWCRCVIGFATKTH